MTSRGEERGRRLQCFGSLSTASGRRESNGHQWQGFPSALQGGEGEREVGFVQLPAASRPACQNAASSRVAVRKVAASESKRAEPPRRPASASSASTSAFMNA